MGWPLASRTIHVVEERRGCQDKWLSETDFHSLALRLDGRKEELDNWF